LREGGAKRKKSWQSREYVKDRNRYGKGRGKRPSIILQNQAQEKRLSVPEGTKCNSVGGRERSPLQPGRRIQDSGGRPPFPNPGFAWGGKKICVQEVKKASPKRGLQQRTCQLVGVGTLRKGINRKARKGTIESRKVADRYGGGGEEIVRKNGV